MNVEIKNANISLDKAMYNPPLREHALIKYMAQFVTITDAEAQILVDEIDLRYYKKGTVLLHENQISELSYFVLQGCVRQFFMIDGEEKTTNFFIEGQPISLFKGIYKNMPSKYYLSCVEDCLLSVGETSEPDTSQINPKFIGVCQTIAEDEWSKAQDTFSSYLINSPEDRYLNLMKARPDLIDRVPQYQLASYLGIKPESLSRIRRRIMGKAK